MSDVTERSTRAAAAGVITISAAISDAYGGAQDTHAGPRLADC